MASYDTDFHQWIGEQAALLKAGQLGGCEIPQPALSQTGAKALPRQRCCVALPYPAYPKGKRPA